METRDDSALAAEGVGPYEDPFRSGCRAGTCAPPFRCLNAAAHGWPPYAGWDADSPENGNPSGAFCRVVEDADPYETGLAEFAKQINQIDFSATCAVKNLLRARATRAPRFDQTGQSPVR